MKPSQNRETDPWRLEILYFTLFLPFSAPNMLICLRTGQTGGNAQAQPKSAPKREKNTRNRADTEKKCFFPPKKGCWSMSQHHFAPHRRQMPVRIVQESCKNRSESFPAFENRSRIVPESFKNRARIVPTPERTDFSEITQKPPQRPQLRSNIAKTCFCPENGQQTCFFPKNAEKAGKDTKWTFFEEICVFSVKTSHFRLKMSQKGKKGASRPRI